MTLFRCLKLGIGRALGFTVLTLLAVLMTQRAFAASDERFVPADSPFYFGTLEPIDIEAIVALIPAFSESELKSFTEVLKQNQAPEQDANVKHAQEAFIDSYGEFLRSPKVYLSYYGIGDSIEMSFYMAGLAPVLRVGLADTEQFLSAINDFNENQSLTPDTGEIDGIGYFRYPLGKSGMPAQPANPANPSKMGLIIATIGDDAIFTVDYGEPDSPDLLAKALGVTAPEQTVADSGYVSELVARWNYSSGTMFYFDFRKLVAMLTGSDTEMGADLAAMMKLTSPADQTYSQLRAPQCAAELASIAEVWPRVVGGHRSWNTRDTNIDGQMHGVVEVNHAQLTGILTKFRGHIPAIYRETRNLFSFALGMDFGRLGQALGELNLLMSKLNYACPLLSNLNQLASPQAAQMVMGATMMSGFANGVRGIGATWFNGEVFNAQGAPALANFDGLISLSAVNPQLLLQTAKAIPQFANIEIPEDGSPVDLGPVISQQAGMPIDAKAAQKGNHIVLFRGEGAQALSDDIDSGSEEDNGFVFVSFNMRDMMAQMGDAAKNYTATTGEGDAEALQDQLDMFIGYYPNGHVDYGIDFSASGIEFIANFDFQRPAE